MRHKLKACGCWAISLAVIFSGLIVVTTPGRLAAGNCEFVLGFKFLHDLEGSAVGDCVGNQAFGGNGDALQPTTKGLLVWRKADNFTAFTDGYESWVNGPFGVQERMNSQRFWWEKRGRGEGHCFCFRMKQPGRLRTQGKRNGKRNR